ncbi:hypothetical protein Q8F55_001053 [Vanrija albida]|uniref:FAD/NAD(P)-binding domain-containing protein n=1 Tax=Vanrija albida TaxID=181172 RepID=A0ABR3QFH3_9TREE
MLPLTTLTARTALRAIAHTHTRAASSFAASTTVVDRRGRIVILGSGWAGYNLARKIDKSFYDVTVVSPNSYFSFTPFLASTTVGTLEFRCATEPVRSIPGVDYAQARAESVDFANKTVKVAPASLSDHTKVQRPTADALAPVALLPEQKLSQSYEVPYDALVIATGCRSASFGIPGVAEHAMFLKDVRDARRIRLRLLQCLELASEPNITDEERRALLSFRVVGGGPTGVEFAAELCDFITQDVERLYPRLRGLASITLYDVAPGILMSFDGELRHYAEKKFARDGVKVRGNSKIVAAGPDWIELATKDGTEKVPYGMLVWSTGLSVNPFVSALQGVKKDKHTGSIYVDPYLRVIDDAGAPMQNVFAVGDNATPESGNRLPATAQVASQMAHYMNKKFNRIAQGKDQETLAPFSWKNKGSMVFVGTEQALVDRSSIEGPKSKLSGFAAWFIWRSYYMTLSMSWRNQVLVPMYWALAYFFGRDVTRF